MYALVEIKGKQYKAEKGTLLKVDKIDSEKGDALEFENVLMLSNDDEVRIGTPYVEGIKVQGLVEDQIKDKKIIVFKYKKRKNYKRTQGHRQQYTLVRINEIVVA
jgi:large subunit ribosomal protein L21